MVFDPCVNDLGMGEQWDSADVIKLSSKTEELQKILIKLGAWTDAPVDKIHCLLLRNIAHKKALILFFHAS